MEAVAEMTNFNFEQIYHLTALEFFAYTSYLDYKARREQQRMRQMEAKMKKKH